MLSTRSGLSWVSKPWFMGGHTAVGFTKYIFFLLGTNWAPQAEGHLHPLCSREDRHLHCWYLQNQKIFFLMEIHLIFILKHDYYKILLVNMKLRLILIHVCRLNKVYLQNSHSNVMNVIPPEIFVMTNNPNPTSPLKYWANSEKDGQHFLVSISLFFCRCIQEYTVQTCTQRQGHMQTQEHV